MFLNKAEEIQKIAQVIKAMYADDVSILASFYSGSECSGQDYWIKEWKLNFNNSKSESIFSTLCNAELDWKPSINVKKNHTLKHLDVTFDRSLSFRPHIEETVRKTEMRMSLNRAVGNTSW